MNLDNRNSELLRQEAHSVAIRSEEPFVAWSELKRWSLGKGQAGTKAALMEFMEQHGRKPESAAILPEIARMASMMHEPDRREMLELTHRWFSVSAGFERAVSPISRAIGSIFPAKKAQEKQVPAPHPDITRMMEQRDIIFHVNRGGLGLPVRGMVNPTVFPPPRMRVITAGAGKGHALIRSLSERLSVHGHEPGHERPAYMPAAAKKRPSVKKKAARRPAKKKVALRAPTRRKPVRKKSRRK